MERMPANTNTHLSGLEGTVRVPHTAGLRHGRFMTLRTGRVGGRSSDHRLRFRKNDSDRNATQTGSADDDGSCPASQGLHKRAAVKETRHPLRLCSCASDDIVRALVWWDWCRCRCSYQYICLSRASKRASKLARTHTLTDVFPVFASAGDRSD
jgi:hypothetical protein